MNSATACRAFKILSFMLPLISRMIPTETGVSSLQSALDTLFLFALIDCEIVFVETRHQSVH